MSYFLGIVWLYFVFFGGCFGVGMSQHSSEVQGRPQIPFWGKKHDKSWWVVYSTGCSTFPEMIYRNYPLVIWHSYGESPFLIGKSSKTSINGPFSMATLNNQRVYIELWHRWRLWWGFGHFAYVCISEWTPEVPRFNLYIKFSWWCSFDQFRLIQPQKLGSVPDALVLDLIPFHFFIHQIQICKISKDTQTINVDLKLPVKQEHLQKRIIVQFQWFFLLLDHFI